MADRMPPPGSKGPGVAIIVAEHKADGRMPPPGMKDQQGSGKVSPEDAKLVLADEHCNDCTMYHHDTGECDKVDGTMDPQDGCYEYFQRANEPDADEQGGPSDNDADDQGARQ